MQSIRLEKVYNLRDVAESGSSLIPHGSILRSASLSFATDQDIAVIVDELNVNAIVDLRTLEEAFPSEKKGKHAILTKFNMIEASSADPNATRDDILEQFFSNGDRYLIFIPLINKSEAFRYFIKTSSLCTLIHAGFLYVTGRVDLVERLFLQDLWKEGLFGVNRFILECGKKEICIALKLISCAPNNVLFNCSWGKDRTGLIAMFVQHIFGYDEDLILKNYEQSSDNLPEKLMDTIPESWRDSMGQEGFSLQDFFGSPRHVLLQARNFLISQYGSIDCYLDQIGFDSEWKKIMVNR